MEYAPPVLLQSKNNIATLQIIQNQALRIILKAPYRTPIKDLHAKANIETIDSRINKLNDNYWLNCKLNNNELIEQLG